MLYFRNLPIPLLTYLGSHSFSSSIETPRDRDEFDQVLPGTGPLLTLILARESVYLLKGNVTQDNDLLGLLTDDDPTRLLEHTYSRKLPANSHSFGYATFTIAVVSDPHSKPYVTHLGRFGSSRHPLKSMDVFGLPILSQRLTVSLGKLTPAHSPLSATTSLSLTSTSV